MPKKHSENLNKRFISFEGIDFSGKSTQIVLLTRALEDRGQSVLVLREPGGTYISEKIRDILLDIQNTSMTPLTETLLYSAARHQLLRERIIDELNSGNFVIADRYVDSTTAYQGYGRKLPLDFIKELNKIVTMDVLPALTFYLDIDFEESVRRRKKHGEKTDRIESTGREFYTRIRKGYHKIAELDKSRVITIDGHLSVEKIKQSIWEFASQILNL